MFVVVPSDVDWGGAETFFARFAVPDVLGFQFDLAGSVDFESFCFHSGVAADTSGLNLGLAPALYCGELFGADVALEVAGIAAEAAATWAVGFR